MPRAVRATSFAPRVLPALARPRRAVRRGPRHAVVFVHGHLGFDTIELAGIRREYFRGLPAMLAKLGVEAYFLKLAPVAGVGLRARQLTRFVRERAANAAQSHRRRWAISRPPAPTS